LSRKLLLPLLLVVATLQFASAENMLNGAGATFPFPIYSKWFSEYHKLHPEVEINYQSIGSGGGIRQLTAGTVDFGASDGPMTDQQLVDAKQRIFHLPTVLGSVVPAYNLPGVGEIKFTPQILAGIFLGNIAKWNDKVIADSNPGVRLPDKSIIVVHRSDGSGTSYCFTDYLSKVSPEWAARVGKSTSVKWPVGLGAKGNEGVAGMVRTTDGSIGYVELIYALQNKIQFGPVKNSAGNFVKASLESTTAAAASLKAMPDDFRVSITNAPGKDAYPISTFTWLLVPAQWKDAAKGKIMVDFLNWMLDHGEQSVQQLDYAPLPQAVADKERATIKQIK
jgi:phosphate transport system substrate-binding protein